MVSKYRLYCTEKIITWYGSLGSSLCNNWLHHEIIWFTHRELVKANTCTCSFEPRWASMDCRLVYLALLITTCSRGTFRVTLCRSSVKQSQYVFNHLLLPNHSAYFNQIWQKYSLGGPLSCSQNLIPSKTGCHDNQKKFSYKFFKNLLLLSDF